MGRRVGTPLRDGRTFDFASLSRPTAALRFAAAHTRPIRQRLQGSRRWRLNCLCGVGFAVRLAIAPEHLPKNRRYAFMIIAKR